MESKQLIRRNILNKLESMSEQHFNKKCQFIASRFLQSTLWKRSQVVAMTVSTKREVNTYPIIEQGWKENKQIVVPRTDFQSKAMTFHQIDDWNDVVQTPINLFEPAAQKATAYLSEDIDLVVVPGVAFDQNGFRIGYGGGFYDRYLANYKGQTVALATEVQIQPELPVEPHDRPVDYVITESRCLTC
ncbi:5-formyltetrahydrofolate cyclo-ligase [Halalkalibacter hemicellulosilyticus]|uniref:5-formyltetrahydrofolate cyclo-ligase n=1 Tax=Halalkalibacter hemicellulosilyticusJCM 9152 TaxID=1236971 RepID=W4QGE7_9BACI|nr:5-formyltetrahydrofolate cyclo-ligase [Halalkalibacter hemicellulosilyticus]GAE30728.1 5-formyltetrahydrofolate cyclo-ligase [Halalkalibacter hemicellulosilyticusJCM 9152]